jgi:hypothetical protein
MRMSRNNVAAALTLSALLLAACGGGSGPAQTQAASDSEQGSPTDGPATLQPAATVDAGGNGGNGGNGGGRPAGWDQYGKVHVDVSGPVTKSADYGFMPAGSLFGGAQGSALNFAIEGTSELVSILVNPDGTVVVSYASADFSMPAAECTTSDWNLGATSGSGSFDCTAGVVILGSGAMAQDGRIKGSFEAHA